MWWNFTSMKGLKRIWLQITSRSSLFIVFFFVFGVWIGRNIDSDKSIVVDNVKQRYADRETITNVPQYTQVIQQKAAAISSTHEFDNNLDTIEELMESTLRNCLGSKCFNQLVTVAVTTTSSKTIHTPSHQSNAMNRIGLLSLPQSGGEVLYELLSIFNNMNSNKDKIQIEIIPEMHVPAYGYGKNHGWSSIIRLSRRVIHHAYAIIKKNNQMKGNDVTDKKVLMMRSPSSEDTKSMLMKESDDEMMIFASQITQITIFQCRNSHVAAHTRMFTVFTDQLYLRPLIELDKILTFIGIDYDRQELLSKLKILQFQNKLKENFYEMNLPFKYYQYGLKILNHELESTESMTAWPCKSFKTNIHQYERLFIQPHELNPNCSAPYVKCTVPFDIQEMH